jgi:3',5'-cyclic AMP phosphodiesterase CpdA
MSPRRAVGITVVGLLVVALIAACAKGRDEPARSAASSPRSAPARLLVIGDVQLAAAFKGTPTRESWRAPLDTSGLAARLAEAVAESHPTHILQTGDLVDLNEAAVLEVRDSEGRIVERTNQPFEEWHPVLATFPSAIPLYPVVGNHERYGELVVSARIRPDTAELDIRDVTLTRRLAPSDVHARLLARFPQLTRGAEFHGRSGSYFVEDGRFCLLSLDGADFEDDPTLYEFVTTKLVACRGAGRPAIVACRYPLFSGRSKADDPSLELRRDRERLLETFGRYGAALVLAGHEHFYLRYLSEGRRRAGYVDSLPPAPIYMTVASFANPYPRSIARLDPAEARDAIRYFRGTHYASVVIDDTKIDVTVRGYDDGLRRWETIDAFTLPSVAR